MIIAVTASPLYPGVPALMKKQYIYGSTLAALLLTSCASSFVHIAQQSCAEATALKNSCTALKRDALERISADSLYNQGANLIRTGYYEKADVLLNRVIVKYRLILLRNTIAVKERELNQQKRDLAEEQKELSECMKIIDELSSAQQQP